MEDLSYSLFILIPVILIVISLIFIIINFLRSEGKARQKKVIKREQDRAKVDERNYVSAIKKLESLKKRTNRLEIRDSWSKFSAIIKEFFKELLEIEYEFTYDELIAELKKRNRKKEFIEFLNKLNVRYEMSISKEELNSLLLEVLEILKQSRTFKNTFHQIGRSITGAKVSFSFTRFFRYIASFFVMKKNKQNQKKKAKKETKEKKETKKEKPEKQKKKAKKETKEKKETKKEKPEKQKKEKEVKKKEPEKTGKKKETKKKTEKKKEITKTKKKKEQTKTKKEKPKKTKKRLR